MHREPGIHRRRRALGFRHRGARRRTPDANRCPMSDADRDQNEVRGERDATSVNRRSSMQSRISSLLAIGLMSVLGLGMLTWYYANAVSRQSRARQSARTLSTSRAQGEMSLPSLGRIDQPPPPPGPAFDAAPFPPPDLPSATPLNPTTLREIPLE